MYDNANMPTISARLPDDEADELDEVAALLDEDRSTVIRKALDEGMHTLRVRLAVQRYQTGAVSVKEAARIAGVSLGDWFDIAREHNLTTQLTPDDIERDVETLRDP
jgi:predicted HTH domain antitoxin